MSPDPAAPWPEQAPGHVSETSNALYLFDDLPALRWHTRELIGRCRYRLRLYSVALDHAWLDHPEIADALSSFARAAPRNTAELLLLDTLAVIDRSHALVRLQQRLTDKIALRRLEPDVDPENIHQLQRQFLIGDDDKLLLLHAPDSYRGFANYAARPDVKPLDAEFEFLWQHSEPDIRLQRLPL